LGELLLIMTKSNEAQPRNSWPREIKNHYKENKRSLPKPLSGLGFLDPTAQSTSQLKSSLSLLLLGK
jgi:hypothetical protein